MLKYVETKNAPAAIGPYSQGIICNGIAFSPVRSRSLR